MRKQPRSFRPRATPRSHSFPRRLATADFTLNVEVSTDLANCTADVSDIERILRVAVAMDRDKTGRELNQATEKADEVMKTNKMLVMACLLAVTSMVAATVSVAAPKAAPETPATSLEHAVPIPHNNPQAQTDAPATVDPVKRYLHNEKAYLDGELDPAFENFSAWEYRMIVQCGAPDTMLAWGREMLRNYRPDYIATPDGGWRYAQIVKSDVLDSAETDMAVGEAMGKAMSDLLKATR